MAARQRTNPAGLQKDFAEIAFSRGLHLWRTKAPDGVEDFVCCGCVAVRYQRHDPAYDLPMGRERYGLLAGIILAVTGKRRRARRSAGAGMGGRRWHARLPTGICKPFYNRSLGPAEILERILLASERSPSVTLPATAECCPVQALRYYIIDTPPCARRSHGAE